MDWPRILANVQASTGQLREDARLVHARARLNDALDAPLSIEALARAAGMSREHFTRSFKRTYGLTPHQYRTRQRILVAREKLDSTDLSVTEICMELGFSSLGSFTTLFKRHIGHPPGRYRRRWIQAGAIAPAAFIPTCFLAHFGHISRSAAQAVSPTVSA